MQSPLPLCRDTHSHSARTITLITKMSDLFTISNTKVEALPSALTNRRALRRMSLSSCKGPDAELLLRDGSWGRAGVRRSWLYSFFSAMPVFLAPVALLSAFITLQRFDGNLSAFVTAVTQAGFLNMLSELGPAFSVKGLLAWVGWLSLQAALYCSLPGLTQTGQRTPAGHLLDYKINGLSAWLLTHVLYAGLCWYGLVDPAFVPRNWSGLVAAMNATGILLSMFAYVRAHVSPTHEADRKFSGNFIARIVSIGRANSPRLRSIRLLYGYRDESSIWRPLRSEAFRKWQGKSTWVDNNV